MEHEQSKSSASAKPRRGRPRGVKTTGHPVADIIVPPICISSQCGLSIDHATVVPGSQKYLFAHYQPPHNFIVKQKVKCKCGQIQWRQTRTSIE